MKLGKVKVPLSFLLSVIRWTPPLQLSAGMFVP